jgi:hypothetical protein
MAIGVNIFKKDLLTGKVRINHLVEEKEKWTEIYKQFYKNVKII